MKTTKRCYVRFLKTFLIEKRWPYQSLVLVIRYHTYDLHSLSFAWMLHPFPISSLYKTQIPSDGAIISPQKAFDTIKRVIRINSCQSSSPEHSSHPRHDHPPFLEWVSILLVNQSLLRERPSVSGTDAFASIALGSVARLQPDAHFIHTVQLIVVSLCLFCSEQCI